MTETVAPGRAAADRPAMADLRFVWLEITGKCQLECVHCYADSGPAGTHGVMTPDDWCRVIDECAALGVATVQFIGGEPTRHPALADLIEHALAVGLKVEVFSNLVHVSDVMWEIFDQPGVRLACSYYSDDPAEHAQVTGRDTWRQTRKNITEAVRRSIPLRVGIIDMLDGQRADQAASELRALGVTEIGTDRLRQVGRGVREAVPSTDQLCGRCGDGNLAVAPDGRVWPCVFTRWMPVGSLLRTPLVDIITGPAMIAALGELKAAFDPIKFPCVPEMCDPQCGPRCSPACIPQCAPKSGPCGPRGGCVPNYRCRPGR